MYNYEVNKKLDERKNHLIGFRIYMHVYPFSSIMPHLNFQHMENEYPVGGSVCPPNTGAVRPRQCVSAALHLQGQQGMSVASA